MGGEREKGKAWSEGEHMHVGSICIHVGERRMGKSSLGTRLPLPRSLAPRLGEE